MLPGARNHGTRLIHRFGPAALFIFVAAVLSQSTPSSRWLRQDADAPFLHVAHALGAIDSAVYTNSAEAFHGNYTAGFRHFEVVAARIAPYGVSLPAFTINEPAEMRRPNELGVRG